MRTALYPGTFDPVTLGHIDIIRRACTLVDKLVIGVAINEGKGPLFSLEERVAMIDAECVPLGNEVGCEIIVHPFKNLLIDCARDVGATVIVRGLRALSDFEYEYQMAGMNQQLDDEVETVFLMADVCLQPIASKLVKEIALYGGEIAKFVSPEVESDVLGRVETIGRKGDL